MNESLSLPERDVSSVTDARSPRGALPTAFLAITTPAMTLYALPLRRVDAVRGAHCSSLLAAAVALFFRAPTRSAVACATGCRSAVGPFLYVELRWLIAGVGRPHADALVSSGSTALLPGNPSATWAPSLPSLALSEVLHFAYASYYLLMLRSADRALPPRAPARRFASTMLALTIVYGVCFVTYLLFPVDGPRYLVGPAAAPGARSAAFVLRCSTPVPRAGRPFRRRMSRHRWWRRCAPCAFSAESAS